MNYFVIYSDQSSQELISFKKNNQHLTVEISPIKANSSNLELREELLKDHLITQNNKYDMANLALTKAHISLWKQAVQNQSSITVFESNIITHKNFLNYQEISLSAQQDYDLMIWGYNLNWNPCIELMPCLPKAIYTFPGYNKDEFKKENNDLIDIPTYQNSDLKTIQTLKIFSFAGLGCYTISAKGAEALLQKVTPIGNEPAPSYQNDPHGSNFYVFKPIPNRENISLDIEVNRYLKKLNTYMTIPMLAVISTNTN
ncbi:glycosyltransferase family 25 protein [Commensalibacter papalotli (ex Servin-Garciduenas et al. 2014)]|uniref:Glycosyl transferase family 25 domain-containing protein n=1 Tax=Commensalibacter papalotli (ex Servin-Garciduenas et al. 2014) TaxID=1208583 RepID=W7DYT9_9PROT|nr:glycosyltransferase family 25 protein [Commensalibacter papalotli (ex Servin-Garciduenas et al. 2014)]EUK19178.1 hypothetical protein COMX_05490 [Commensalibacter papalotli (ex Servin-Garciduenas et al. 2014)]